MRLEKDEQYLAELHLRYKEGGIFYLYSTK